MPTFESIHELEKYMSSRLAWAMGNAARDVKKDLQKNYEELWYGRDFIPNEESYERTHQLTKGVGIKKLVIPKTDPQDSAYIEYEIGWDGKEIKPRRDDDHFFNAYMSLNGSEISKGKYITERIGDWIEKGTHNKFYSMPAKHIFQITRKDFTKTRIENILKKHLISQGFEFK